MSEKSPWQKLVGGLKKMMGGSEEQPAERPQSRDEIAAELFRRPAPTNPTTGQPEPDSPMHRAPGMYTAESEPLSFTEQAALNKWLKAMPVALAGIWKPAVSNIDTLDFTSMRLALLEEYPDPSKQALDLLAWYGQGIGRWDDYPQWETVAKQFLMELPLNAITQAMEDNPLDDAHLEGAARFFSGDLFQAMRGHELAQLPPDIKTALLEHVQEQQNAAKIDRVQQIM